jgi:hypothetical protein
MFGSSECFAHEPIAGISPIAPSGTSSPDLRSNGQMRAPTGVRCTSELAPAHDMR